MRISHHGAVPVSGTLHWSLRSGGGTCTASVEAKAFLVTEPVAVTVSPSVALDRLDLWLTDASGATVARAFVDLAS